MAIYFSSDLHFLHKNMVSKYNRTDLGNLDNMHMLLVRDWNRAVSPQDTVYVLGDVLIGNPKKAIPYLKKLNGKIKVLPGNHDYPNVLRALANELDWEILKPYHEIKDHDQLYVLCHYPFVSYKNSNHGAIHLHGHTHGTYYAQGNILDVGIDSIFNLIGERRPVNMKEIPELIRKKDKLLQEKQLDIQLSY